MVLNLSGYKAEDENSSEESYTFDLIDIKNEDKILIENVYIIDEEDSFTTSQEWEISVSFNNYKNYNQANNAGKEAKGNLKFQIVECERRK